MSKEQAKSKSWCTRSMFLSTDVYSQWLYAVFVSAQHLCVNSLLHGFNRDSWSTIEKYSGTSAVRVREQRLHVHRITDYQLGVVAARVERSVQPETGASIEAHDAKESPSSRHKQSPTPTPQKVREIPSRLNLDDVDPSPISEGKSQGAHKTKLAERSPSANKSRDSPRRRKARASPDLEQKRPLVDVVGSGHSQLASHSFRVAKRSALSVCLAAEACGETDSWSTNDDEVGNFLATRTPRHLTPFQSSAQRCPERATGGAKNVGNNSVTQTLWEAFERKLAKIEWKEKDDPNKMPESHWPSTDFQTKEVKSNNLSTSLQKSLVCKDIIDIKNVSYPSIELSLDEPHSLQRKTSLVYNVGQLKTSSAFAERSDITYSVSNNDKLREAGVGPGSTVNKSIKTLETDTQESWPDGLENSLSCKVDARSNKQKKQTGTKEEKKQEDDYHDLSLMSYREQVINPEEIHMVESLSKMEEILEGVKCPGYAQSTSASSFSEQSTLALHAGKPTTYTRSMFYPRNRQRVVTSSRDNIIDVGANASLLSACSQKLYSKAEAKPSHKWVVYPEKVSQTVISVTDALHSSSKVCNKIVKEAFPSDGLHKTSSRQDERLVEDNKTEARHFKQMEREKTLNSPTPPPFKSRKRETNREKHQNEHAQKEMDVAPTFKKRKRGVSGRQTGMQQATNQLSTSISQEWANIKEQFKSIYQSTNLEKGDFQKKKTEAPPRVSSPAASLESQFGPSTALENILLNKNPLRNTILLCKSGFVTTYEDYQRVKDQGPGLVSSSKKRPRSKRTPSLMRFLEQIEKDEAVSKDPKEDAYSPDGREGTEIRRDDFPEVKAEKDATGLKRREKEKPALPQKRTACIQYISPASLVLQPPHIFQERKVSEYSGKNETITGNSRSYSCIPRSKQTSKTEVKCSGLQNFKTQSMLENIFDTKGHGCRNHEWKLNQKLKENQATQTSESQSRHGNAKRLTSKIPIPNKERKTVINKKINKNLASQPSNLKENKEIRTEGSSSLLHVFLNLNLSPISTSPSQCSLPHVGSNTILEVSTPRPLSGSMTHSVPHIGLSPFADELALETYVARNVSSAPVTSPIPLSACPKKRERLGGVEVKRTSRHTIERHASAPTQKQPTAAKTSSKTVSVLNKTESRLNRAHNSGCETSQSHSGRAESVQKSEGRMKKAPEQHGDIQISYLKLQPSPEKIVPTGVPLIQETEDTKQGKSCNKKQALKELEIMGNLSEAGFVTKTENHIPEGRVKQVTEIKKNASQLQLRSSSVQRHKTSPVKAKSVPSMYRQTKLNQSTMAQEAKNVSIPAQENLEENQTDTSHAKQDSHAQLAPTAENSSSQLDCTLSSHEAARPASTTRLDDPHNEISGQSGSSLKLNANRVSFSMDNVCQGTRGKLMWKGTLTFRKRVQRFSQSRLMGKKDIGTDFKSPSVWGRQSSSISSFTKVQRGQSEPKMQTKKKELFSSSSTWPKKKPFSIAETVSSTSKSSIKKESCPVRKHVTGSAKNKLPVRGTTRNSDSGTITQGTQLKTENRPMLSVKPDQDATIVDAASGHLTTPSKGDENPLVTIKYPKKQHEHSKELRPNRNSVTPETLTLLNTRPKKTVTTVANRAKSTVGTRMNFLGSRAPNKIAAAKPIKNPQEKLLNNLCQAGATSRAKNYKQASLLFPQAKNHDVTGGTPMSSLRIPSKVDVTKEELQDLLNKVKLDSKLTTQKSNTALCGKFSTKRKGVNSEDKMSRSWSEARLARPPRYLKRNVTQRNAAVCILNASKIAQNQMIMSTSEDHEALTEVHEKSPTQGKIMNNGLAALDKNETKVKTVNESGTDSVSFSNNVVEVSEQPPTTTNEDASRTNNLKTYSLTLSSLPEQRPDVMTIKAEDSKNLKSSLELSWNETDVHEGHDQDLTLACSLQQNIGKASENESLRSTEEPTKTDADSGICTAENSQQKLTTLGHECRSQDGVRRHKHLDILSQAITDSMEQSLSSGITIINRLHDNSKADPGSVKQKQTSLRPGDNDATAEVAVQRTDPLGSNGNQPAGKCVPEGFNDSSSRGLQTQNYLHAKEATRCKQKTDSADARNQQTTAGVDVATTSSSRKDHNRSQGDFVFSRVISKTANGQSHDARNAVDVKHSSPSISNSMLLLSHSQESSFTNIKDTPHSEGLDEATTSSLILSPSQCNLETGEAVLINVISGGRIRQMKTLRPVLAPSENCTTSFDVHAVPGVTNGRSSVSVELETAECQGAPLSQQNHSVFVLGVPESPASNQSFLVETLASEDTLVSVNMEQEAQMSMIPRKVERSPEIVNLLEPLNRNLERNWDQWEDEFYFSPAKDSVDSQHCSKDFYIEQVDTIGVQIPGVRDHEDKMPVPCYEMEAHGKDEYALKPPSPNSIAKNSLDRKRDNKLSEKSPFRTEGSVSLVDSSTKKCKGGVESEKVIINETPQPPYQKLADEPDRNDCFPNSFPFSCKKELVTKTEGNRTTHNFENDAGNHNEKVQDDAKIELRKNHELRNPSLEKEKQHPPEEVKKSISTTEMLFKFPAGKEQAIKQKNKSTRFSPVDEDSSTTGTDQNYALKIDRAKSRSPRTKKRPVEASKPTSSATNEKSPKLEICKKTNTKRQQLSAWALQSSSVPKRKREKTRSKVKTLRDLLWTPVEEELKQQLRKEAKTSEKLAKKSRTTESNTSASLGKEPRSGINGGTTQKADIKTIKDEPEQNVGKANVGLEQMFKDKPKLTLKDKIEDLEMLLNSEINKYKASRERGKETTQLFGTGTGWSESASRRSKKSDVTACDRSSRTKSRMSSASDRQFQGVREKPQFENDSNMSLKSESNNRRDNSPVSQPPQKSEHTKLNKKPGKYRGRYTRLDDFIRFSEGTGECPMPVKKSEADDTSSITYLTPTSEEDERLNTILKQTSSNFSMSKRRRLGSRARKTNEEATPAADATVKQHNSRSLNDSCQDFTGTPGPVPKTTSPRRSNNKSLSKTPHQPKETSLSHQFEEIPHARSHRVKNWSPEFKSVAGAKNMDISSASSSDIVLSWVGSCSNLDEDVTPGIPPQPCNQDPIKDVTETAQARSPTSRRSRSQTHWVKNQKEFSKVWEEDRDRFHRWRLGVNTKDHLSVTEEMVFEEVDNEREYYKDQTAPAGDIKQRPEPVLDGFLQTYIGNDINNFLYQSSEMNSKQPKHGQDAKIEPFNFPEYQGNLDSPRKNRASNQKRGMNEYTPSPRSPSHSTSFSDGQEVGMTTKHYFKYPCSSSQNLADKPRSPERLRRARHSRHYRTTNNDPKSTKEREGNPVIQRRHTFRVDTPDRLTDQSHTDQEKGRYVQSAWEYQKIRSVPKELSPRPEQDQLPSCSTRDDDPFLRHDQNPEKDCLVNSYARDKFVSIHYRARTQEDLSPNSVKDSDCFAAGERRDSGDSVRREDAVSSEKREGGRHRWHSSETLTSVLSPGKRVRRKDRDANLESSERQNRLGKPQHSTASLKLSLHQHLSTKPTTDEHAATNDNSNSSQASVNWYRPQSLSSSTSVQNGPMGGASASGTTAAIAATPLTERSNRDGVNVTAPQGVDNGAGGQGWPSLDTPVRLSLGSSTVSRTAPRRQIFKEIGRKNATHNVGKIVQMFEQKKYQ